MSATSDFSAVNGIEISGLSALAADLKARWIQHKLYRQTVAELSALSNRELADLGINRSMIKSIAKQATQDFVAN